MITYFKLHFFPHLRQMKNKKQKKNKQTNKQKKKTSMFPVVRAHCFFATKFAHSFFSFFSFFNGVCIHKSLKC